MIGTEMDERLSRRRFIATWDAAVRTLDRLDPHAVFTSPLLRSLLRASRR